MRAPSVDLHADTLMAIVHEGHRLDGSTRELAELDAPRMAEGGLDAQFFAIFVTPYWQGEAAEARAHQLIDRLEVELADPVVRALVRPAVTAKDVEEATTAGRRSALYGIEGAHVLGGRLEAVARFAARGVRYIGLTWANPNECGDSSGSPPLHGGLTAFGRQVVREVENRGVLVDVSHVADSTFWDVAHLATAPFIASHSSCRAVAPHPRNLADEQLRALAESGGVVGINFHSGFIDPRWVARPWAPAWRSGGPFADPLEAERIDRHSRPAAAPRPASLEQLVEHFLHALEVAGPEHVALGSDRDGKIVPPTGLEDVSRLPALRAALAGRGVAEAALNAVWGGNVLRVLAEADQRRTAA